MERFQLVVSPGRWLAQTLKIRGLSQNGFAHLMGLDSARVGKFVRSGEKIPRHHLAEMARLIGSPAEFEYVLRLKDCEEVSDQLSMQIGRFARRFQVEAAAVEKTLLAYIETIVAHEHCAEPAETAGVLARYLTDALFVVRLVVGSDETGLISPLISRGNIIRHLQYPVVHFLGLLIDLGKTLTVDGRHKGRLDELREKGLRNLRQVVRAKKARDRQETLARQHTIFTLARYGGPDDRCSVKEMISTVGTTDPMSRKLGFTGLILADGSPDMIDRFLFELQRDPDLAHANVAFDAHYYGDSPLNETGDLLHARGDFRRTLTHILRHLEHPECYRSILAVEFSKLTDLAERLGPEPFMAPGIRERVRNVLDQGAPAAIEQRGVRERFVDLANKVLEGGNIERPDVPAPIAAAVQQQEEGRHD